MVGQVHRNPVRQQQQQVTKATSIPMIATTTTTTEATTTTTNIADKDKLLSNPLYIGPGAWFLIHTTAKKACATGGFTSKKEFIELMANLRNEFKCLVCRTHIAEYIDSHPYDSYWNITDPVSGKDVGLFKWSVDFHNAVNKRLNYKILDWNTAYSLWYDNNDVCSMECGH